MSAPKSAIDPIDILLAMGVLYGLADFVCGFIFGRCVLPGLRCGACRGR